MEILIHDLLNRIIEYRHRTFHSGLRIWVCDGRHSVILAGIVEVHLADLLAGALLVVEDGVLQARAHAQVAHNGQYSD